MLPSMRQNIAVEVQFFNTLEQKENFLFILGTLMMRLVSLQKASEILNIEPDAFLKVLDLMNIEFSFLAGCDIQTERVGIEPQL
jgi:hypothetical protein